MASDQYVSNESEISFIRDALAEFCLNAKEPRHAAVWAESILGSFETAHLPSGHRQKPAVHIRAETLVTRIRSEFDGNGTTLYDADIHQKMQSMLEDAFSRYNRD